MNKFSIIIPCYNSSDTIVSVLETLDAQTYKEFEVIFVDDKSTDDTVTKILDYSRHSALQISVIENVVNSGPGFSRNQGLQRALGEYICFMDSDDDITVNYFQTLNEQVQKGADIIYFNCIQLIGNTSIKSNFTPLLKNEDYIALSSGALWMFCSSRSLWKDIEMPSIRNAEDIAVIPIILSRANKITVIPDYLYYYINNNDSLSNNIRPDVSENFIRSFKCTLEYIDKIKYKEQIEFHGIKTVLYGATLNAIRARLSKEVIISYWGSFANDFPQWYHNKYLRQYSRRKRIFLMCVRFRLYRMLKLYVLFHTCFLRFKSR